MPVEPKNHQRHNHLVPRPPQKKTRRNIAAWTISAIAVAGAAGAIAWMIWPPGSRLKTSIKSTPSSSTDAATTGLRPTNATGVAAFFAALSNRTDVAELMNGGTALLANGQNREAIACYRRVLELKPEDEEAHYNLGLAYARNGQMGLAEHHYREALRIFPEYPEAHNNLGNVLTRAKRYAEAVEEFQTALKLQPDYPIAHNNWGRALAEQGDPAAAIPHFLEAVRLDTNYFEAHFNLGNSYLNLGRTNEAVVHFNTVLRIRPDFAPAVQALSRLRTLR
jgi:tetratricopeptide (TPR) repeat protein